MKYELTNASVTEVRLELTSEQEFVETVSFSFGSVKWTFDQDGVVTIKGKGDTHVVAFYDNGVAPVPVMSFV